MQYLGIAAELRIHYGDAASRVQDKAVSEM